jgi:hypothetical protein
MRILDSNNLENLRFKFVVELVLSIQYFILHFILKCDTFFFRTRDNESNLLIQVKELQVELERQRVELEKADNLPDKTSNSEVINLKNIQICSKSTVE